MNARKAIGTAALAASAALVLAGCGGDAGSPDAGGNGADADAPHFIYVTNDPIGVNLFLELGAQGIEEAAEEFGGVGETYESGGDEQSQRANIEAALDEMPDAIVLTTFNLTNLAVEYAQANPEQPFVIIDDCREDIPDNLYCGTFAEHEAAYLAGVSAGMLSESGQVGTVAAEDIPFMHRFSASFGLGAQSVGDDVTAEQRFIGGDTPYADPARGKEVALSLLQTGADHVFAAAAGSNGGIFEAAQESGAFAYGVDANQCPAAPGTVVDNVIKATNVVVVEEIRKILAGEPGGTNTVYDLASGGVSLTSLTEDAADSQCVIMDHPEVIEAVEDVREQIIAGEIVVPDPLQG